MAISNELKTDWKNRIELLLGERIYHLEIEYELKFFNTGESSADALPEELLETIGKFRETKLTELDLLQRRERLLANIRAASIALDSEAGNRLFQNAKKLHNRALDELARRGETGRKIVRLRRALHQFQAQVDQATSRAEITDVMRQASKLVAGLQ